MQFQVQVKLILIVLIILVKGNGEELKCETAKDCERFQHEEFEVVSVCHNATCQCYAFRNPIECFEKNDSRRDLIFRPCPCAMPDAECRDNFCHCRPSYVPSRNMARCIPEKLVFYKECEFDQQCQMSAPFSVCNKTSSIWHPQCMCRNGYTKLLSWKCHSMVPLIVCRKDWHCLRYNSAICALELELCVCKEGYVTGPDYTDCLSASDWGQECVLTGQCQYRLGGGGICENGICRCKEPYIKWEQMDAWGNIKYLCIFPDWETHVTKKENKTQHLTEVTNNTLHF